MYPAVLTLLFPGQSIWNRISDSMLFKIIDIVCISDDSAIKREVKLDLYNCKTINFNNQLNQVQEIFLLQMLKQSRLESS